MVRNTKIGSATSELIEQYSHAYVYLSPEVTGRDSIEEIEQAVAEAVEKLPTDAQQRSNLLSSRVRGRDYSTVSKSTPSWFPMS